MQEEWNASEVRRLDAGEAAVLLSMQKICINFSSAQVFDQISFDVRHCGVRALYEEHAAGEVTRIKILSRAVPVSSGSIQITGRIAGMIDPDRTRQGAGEADV